MHSSLATSCSSQLARSTISKSSTRTSPFGGFSTAPKAVRFQFEVSDENLAGMRRTLFTLLVAAALAAATAKAEPAFVAPRGPGGKPDLNGTWQVMSRANDDLETHPARAARALRDGPHGPVPAKEVLALGAVGAVPAGLGVVAFQVPANHVGSSSWARATPPHRRSTGR